MPCLRHSILGSACTHGFAALRQWATFLSRRWRLGHLRGNVLALPRDFLRSRRAREPREHWELRIGAVGVLAGIIETHPLLRAQRSRARLRKGWGTLTFP